MNYSRYTNNKIRDFKISDKVLKALAEESSSPKILIKAVLGIKNMSQTDLSRILGTCDKNVVVALHDSTGLGPSLLYKMCVALQINPTIVFRNWADWMLKKEQENNPKK